MSKHTAGPWEVRDDATVERTGAMCGVYIGKVDNGIVAEAFSNCLANDDACRANARLIAAAPELLAACRQAIRALNGREHDGFLRAAIASATGERA